MSCYFIICIFIQEYFQSKHVGIEPVTATPTTTAISTIHTHQQHPLHSHLPPLTPTPWQPLDKLPSLPSSAAAPISAIAERVDVPTVLRHQDTTSTETSNQTMTPTHDGSDEQTLVNDESVENIMQMNFDAARQKALRRRSVNRRNSESYDLNRSQTSLLGVGVGGGVAVPAGMMSKRQRSLTYSEPDSGNEQCEYNCKQWIIRKGNVILFLIVFFRFCSSN